MFNVREQTNIFQACLMIGVIGAHFYQDNVGEPCHKVHFSGEPNC